MWTFLKCFEVPKTKSYYTCETDSNVTLHEEKEKSHLLQNGLFTFILNVLVILNLCSTEDKKYLCYGRHL